MQKNIIGTEKAPMIVHSDWENEEEGMVGGVRWDKEENGGRRTVLYILVICWT